LKTSTGLKHPDGDNNLNLNNEGSED